MTVSATTSILPNQHGSEEEEERGILADGVDGVDGVGDNNVDHACDVGDPTAAGNGERNEDDEDGVLSPEDLLLKAVASSALRSNIFSREDADVLIAAQQSGQPQPQLNTSTTAPTTITTAADKVDHDSANTINSNNNESTSNNKIAASNNDNDSSISPPPTGLPTRDRHVALPGAFSSPGPAYPRTPHDDFHDEEVAEATVSAASNNNNNSNNHNNHNALLPTLEATLVMDSASTIRDDNNELLQAAVLVSKEESLTPSPMDKATRQKRLLCWGVLAAVVLLVVVGFTVVLTIKFEDDRFLERSETNNSSPQPNLDDDESKSTESDDADNVHSASRSLRGLDCGGITHCGP